MAWHALVAPPAKLSSIELTAGEATAQSQHGDRCNRRRCDFRGRFPEATIDSSAARGQHQGDTFVRECESSGMADAAGGAGEHNHRTGRWGYAQEETFTD